MTPSMISVDLSGLAKDPLADELGLDPVQPEAFLPSLQEARGWLQDHPLGGSGFLSLDWEGWGLTSCLELAQRLRGSFDRLLILGIGGSALGARALVEATISAGKESPLVILDTVDPEVVEPVLEGLDPKTTAVCAISKSGGTLETLVLLRRVGTWLEGALGSKWAKNLVVITGPDSNPLRQAAVELQAPSLRVPRAVGGRYSVLTPVGLLPAAFAGLDLEALCSGAEWGRSATLSGDDFGANPSWALAAAHASWADRLDSTVSWTYRSRLLGLCRWTQQLWAESLAKPGVRGGRAPVAASVAQGPQDQHSLLQLWMDGPRSALFVLLEQEITGPQVPVHSPSGLPGNWLEGKSLEEVLVAERDGTAEALHAAGRPLCRVRLRTLDEASLGAYFVVFEAAVALLGRIWAINPFDQPAVEGSKVRTARILGRDVNSGVSRG